MLMHLNGESENFVLNTASKFLLLSKLHELETCYFFINRGEQLFEACSDMKHCQLLVLLLRYRFRERLA